MNDCTFCKIVKKEMACHKIYEDDKVMAFLSKNPTNKGHTLIIPKKHSETILDTDDDILKDWVVVIKKVSRAIYKGLKCDGFNIGLNQFREAGQVVPHLHAHIIPRFKNDGFKLWSKKEYKSVEEEREFQAKITRLLK